MQLRGDDVNYSTDLCGPPLIMLRLLSQATRVPVQCINCTMNVCAADSVSAVKEADLSQHHMHGHVRGPLDCTKAYGFGPSPTRPPR